VGGYGQYFEKTVVVIKGWAFHNREVNEFPISCSDLPAPARFTDHPLTRGNEFGKYAAWLNRCHFHKKWPIAQLYSLAYRTAVFTSLSHSCIH